MSKLSPQQKTGNVLRRLVEENYSTQQEFADEIGYEIRAVNRYINEGINKISTVQVLAEFFKVDFTEFFND